jgi:pimeloyl-ACP methyl ester carboxylesterase
MDSLAAAAAKHDGAPGLAPGFISQWQLSPQEVQQIERANATGRTPVLFIHGLWFLASCWEGWAALFEDAGYAPVTPAWPGDPVTIGEARAQPQLLAGRRVNEIAERITAIAGALDTPPVLVGHSLGGTVAQILAGRGVASRTVAIAPVLFRGVLTLRPSVVRVVLPTVSNPANAHRAVRPSYPHFRYAVANALPEREALELYEHLVVPGAGRLLFQATLANVNPASDLRVNTRESRRGPVLILCGGRDHIAPPALAKAAFRLQKRNASSVTRFIELPDRDHALTVDRQWRRVAERVLAFLG